MSYCAPSVKRCVVLLLFLKHFSSKPYVALHSFCETYSSVLILYVLYQAVKYLVYLYHDSIYNVHALLTMTD